MTEILILIIGAPHVILKIYKVYPYTIYYSRQPPPPTYFQCFPTVIGLLQASEAFIYSNILAASYPAPLSRIRLFFEISLNSRHTWLISDGSSRFYTPLLLHTVFMIQ